jgi:hypothetical protein
MHQRRPTTAASRTIAALAASPRIESLGSFAGRFIHALQLIAIHERLGRDPVPELAVRLGGVEVAAKALILAHTELIRADRAPRLWEASLALAAAEMRMR